MKADWYKVTKTTGENHKQLTVSVYEPHYLQIDRAHLKKSELLEDLNHLLETGEMVKVKLSEVKTSKELKYNFVGNHVYLVNAGVEYMNNKGVKVKSAETEVISFEDSPKYVQEYNKSETKLARIHNQYNRVLPIESESEVDVDFDFYWDRETNKYSKFENLEEHHFIDLKTAKIIIGRTEKVEGLLKKYNELNEVDCVGAVTKVVPVLGHDLETRLAVILNHQAKQIALLEKQIEELSKN